MKILNKILRPFGIMIIPRPPSAKMVTEVANVAEVHHPVRGTTVTWMRRLAVLMGEDRR